MRSFIYLASPYSAWKPDGKPDDELMAKRYVKTYDCFQHLVYAGLTVYSPIVMTGKLQLPSHRLSPEFFYEFDKPFLQVASALYVLKLRGWQESTGVRGEIDIIQARNVPVTYLEDTSAHE